ncbi:MAG: phage scaffolding protein [Oscillospiraceae bacterium]|nr:phage scaffolding protein [Oscillospiraceae bacterium]
MTINEILKARGLDDTAITGVLDDLKANKLYFSSEENMDIRYGKLKTQHDGLNQQLTEANALIETLKKSTKGQEDAQHKIADYEQQVQALQAELEKTKVLSEAKFQLKDAGALDVDYLLFKLQEKGELALTEDGKIKDWEDKLAGLKTQIPTQFESKAAGKKNIIENKLPGEEGGGDALTRESLLKKPYAERMKLYSENPEAYKAAMNK